MPTYEYRCINCGDMEIKQSITEEEIKKCPKCGTSDFKKMISKGAGIIFKGSGFYETDYKKKENPEPKAEGTASAACSTCEHAKNGECGSGNK